MNGRRLSILVLLAAVCAISPCKSAVLFADDAATPPEPPSVDAKDALVQYQRELEDWGAANAKTADEFWNLTSEPCYESTKRLLKLDLDAEERLRYDEQMAGVLGAMASRESARSGSLDGARFQELLAFASEKGAAFQRDGGELAKKSYLACVGQIFNARLQFAIGREGEERESEFVALVGDAVSFALAVPEYGENAVQIVLTIRTFDRELGEEALDALCDAFENSGDPRLTQPIQKTSGQRRYARLPGGTLYFEALAPDEEGRYAKEVRLEDYRGKVCLVEIWATWCGPCRKEIPRLKEVYARYRDHGFEILGYSIDQDLDALRRFVDENAIPWLVASQKRSVEAGFKGLYDYYSVNGVPEMILVDRDGKVLQVDCRGVKLSSALQELFPDVEPLGWDPANDFSARATREDAK